MFLASVLILPVGLSYAQTGSVLGGKIGYKSQASDGTTVLIITSSPIVGQSVMLGIGFQDTVGNFIKNQNYAITVMQDNQTVLSVPNAHTDSGTDTQTTQTLSSTDKITIHVTLLGIGATTTLPSTWTGLKGEILNFSQTAQTATTASSGNNTGTMTPGTMNGTMPTSHSMMNNTVTPTPKTLAPLEQVKSGIAPKDVQCKQGYSLILKAEDGSAACVDSSVAQMLVQRGWSAHS